MIFDAFMISGAVCVVLTIIFLLTDRPKGVEA